MSAGPDLHIVWSQGDPAKHAHRVQTLARRLRALALGALAAGLLLAALVAVGVIVTESALRPVRTIAPPGRAAAEVAARAGGTVSSISLLAHDGVLLRGSLFQPARAAPATVVLLHAAADTRRSQLALAGLLLQSGYRVLTPDVRAYGQSGGEVSTGGQLERVDLRGWADRLRQMYPDQCIAAIGAGISAAAVVGAIQVEPFCAAVVEAPLLSLRSRLLYAVGAAVRSPLWLRSLVFAPSIAAGLDYAALRYGITPMHDPAGAGRAIRVPLLVIEDGRDDAVPRREAEQLARTGGLHVTLWTVATATHCAAWGAAPQEYPRRIVAFLDAHR